MFGLAVTPRNLMQEDVQAVARAAALLRIPEFAFFQLAYRRWYGTAARDAEIEPHFAGYMFRGRVPFWVRHLAREVLERHVQEGVRPQDYGVEPVLPEPSGDCPAGKLRPWLLAAVYGGLFLLVTLHAF